MLAASILYLFLSLTDGSKVGANLSLTAFMFVFLLVFGWLFDSWFYKFRVRRWERKRAGG